MLDARNAALALELAKKHRGRIDLLQTDVVMPGMSGRELAKRFTAQRWSQDIVQVRLQQRSDPPSCILDSDTVLLERLFTWHSLLTKVHHVLLTGRSGERATT
jgi:CheY-like chemotaxis protein